MKLISKFNFAVVTILFGLQVIPGLYIGSFRDSKDFTQLENNRITHIISVLDAPKKIHQVPFYMNIGILKSVLWNFICLHPLTDG